MSIKRIAIVPYNIGSMSAKLLAEGLHKATGLPVLRVRKDSVRYQPRYTDYIINWGCSEQWPFITFNKKDGNKLAVNKLQFFQAIQKYNETAKDKTVNIPEWTTSKETAAAWAKDGHTVVGRKLLNSNSGKGIVLYEGNDTVQYCPLYTKYKKKQHEFRVHVFKGEVIDVVQKKKRKGLGDVHSKIRSHGNGWVFCRENIVEPNGLRDQAVRAVGACALPFGAVDVIWNAHENKCYVLEVNSAPGIEGTSLNRYLTAFVKDMK
jgi:glutathione synthase/RimK-type ligase-like ATP-grasp enzyme